MEGGQAVAATLFGENAPAGRTAITWYTGTSDLPQPGDMGMYPNASKQNKGITCEGPHACPSWLCCCACLFAVGFALAGDLCTAPSSLEYKH